MAKKKTKQHQSNEVPRRPFTPEVSPKIDYHRPWSSPYESPLVTLIIGNKRYGIPAYFLQNYQKFNLTFWGLQTITMSNVEEDIGHTVVHFLYTGGYETVGSPLDEGASDLAREYKRSVLVYHASRTWGLVDLEIIAKQKMQQLDEELPVLEILRVMRDVFSSLPAGETWLLDYIQGNLQRLLKPEDPGLGLHDFYNILGQDHRFDNALMKMILEIISARVLSMNEQQGNMPNGITSNNFPLQGPAPEEPESVPEEPKPVPEEPEPVPEEPEPVPKEPEPVPEEPEPAPEEPEPVPEEPEPVPKEPEPVPEEPEPVPEEPEPAPEEPEPVPEEPKPAPEELPPKGDSEQWPIAQVPAGADGWPRASLLPGHTLNAEMSQEAPDQGHIARISCSDLSLYENWENLSSKKRAKRARNLLGRGLPVPSEDGFILVLTS